MEVAAAKALYDAFELDFSEAKTTVTAKSAKTATIEFVLLEEEGDTYTMELDSDGWKVAEEVQTESDE
ncbi:hypothetical protein J2X11_001435 [Aeromicrobium panaciterrae]|uniref:PepSY domain-containing protein n=1 Tax=Aeromicrobium panaciterrae TaxID=363861 RepID=A0ABU1UN39_9ACTN|nr:hypothetical protein [Aeromicrobium panaciterrae]MDR7086596.1 hypothetical protein [Aeromicrobium panaciterrae]